MPRLTSELWVSALLRRVSASGSSAYVRRRGSSEAGSIYILVDDLRGNIDLYCPSFCMSGDRIFERRLSGVSEEECRVRLESEERIDSDIWIIEIESRDPPTSQKNFFECVDVDD